MPRELGGKRWVNRFPTRTLLDDLKGHFQQSAHTFVRAAADGTEVVIQSEPRARDNAALHTEAVSPWKGC
jgi:hypothetical protein